LQIRVPGWLRNEAVPGNLYAYVKAQPAAPSLIINGKEEKPRISKGYMTITREWEKGDVVELSLPMNIHEVKTNGPVADNMNKVAFERGPIVYCAEGIDNPNLSTLAVPDDVNLQSKKQDLLGQSVNVLTGKVQNENLTLIPYYLWSNRGPGKMKVWLPQMSKQ
jgi:DUF1680 family protein